MSEFIKCGCDSYLGNKAGATFQDSLYGQGMRACTPVTSREKTYRCTVCGKEHTKGSVDKKGVAK